MKKTILRVSLAVGFAVLALSQTFAIIPNCASTGNKQDCQDCCVAAKQACQKGAFSKPQCDAFDFQTCIGSCKALDHEEPGTERGSDQPQGHLGGN